MLAAGSIETVRFSALRRGPTGQYETDGNGECEVMDPRTDRELLVAARLETAAFEELYRRHVGATIRFAARRASRPSDVVDLVAAVWLEVVASLDRFEPARGDALPWILGIAANLCSSEQRRQAREREAVRRLGARRSPSDDDYERLESAIDALSVAPALRESLRALPPGERAVAELVLLDELTAEEASEALGVRAAAVRMRLARARRKLRAVVEGHTHHATFAEEVPG
jgi:RNA polymerase sigma factor (sigma-70 family)